MRYLATPGQKIITPGSWPSTLILSSIITKLSLESLPHLYDLAEALNSSQNAIYQIRVKTLVYTANHSKKADKYVNYFEF